MRSRRPRRPPPASGSRQRLGALTRLVAAVALGLGFYCLVVAATALYAQPLRLPDPQELAARRRHLWPALIPLGFLALMVLYAIGVAARRRRRKDRPGPPSTQDPPPITRPPGS